MIRSAMRQVAPLLVVFPGCDDSLPVRERSVAWSSLLQLGCLNEKRRLNKPFFCS